MAANATNFSKPSHAAIVPTIEHQTAQLKKSVSNHDLANSAEQFCHHVKKYSDPSITTALHAVNNADSSSSLFRPETPLPLQRQAHPSSIGFHHDVYESEALTTPPSQPSFHTDDFFDIKRNLTLGEKQRLMDSVLALGEPKHPFDQPPVLATQRSQPSLPLSLPVVVNLQEKYLLRGQTLLKDLNQITTDLVNQLKAHRQFSTSHDRYAVDAILGKVHFHYVTLRDLIEKLNPENSTNFRASCLETVISLENLLDDDSLFSSWSYDLPAQSCVRATSLASIAEESRNARNQHQVVDCTPFSLKNYLRFGNHESLQFHMVEAVRQTLRRLDSLIAITAEQATNKT